MLNESYHLDQCLQPDPLNSFLLILGEIVWDISYEKIHPLPVGREPKF